MKMRVIHPLCAAEKSARHNDLIRRGDQSGDIAGLAARNINPAISGLAGHSPSEMSTTVQ